MTFNWSVDATRVPAPYDPALLGFAPQQIRQMTQAGDPLGMSVAKIWCYEPGNRSRVAAGTGVFVEQDVLLTVGHVLFDPRQFGTQRSSGYVGQVEIESDWLGISGVVTTRLVAAPGWVADPRNVGNDLGIIKLNSPVAGSLPIPPQALADANLLNQAIDVYGFPSSDTQLYNALGSCLALSPDLIFHDADIEDGDSGSPLLIGGPGGSVLAGLHRAGPGSTPTGYPSSVSAFRFTAEAIGWAASIFPHL